jgi:putative inorganic carbon (hco3(-)) transporter
MVTSQQEVLRSEWGRGHSVELVIAVVSATIAAVLVLNPASLLLTLCVPMGVLAFLNFNVFVFATVFLLPWYPFLGWKLPLRDVFLLGRLVLFVGVWILQRKEGVSLRDWLWEGRLKKGIVLFAAVAVVSLLISDSRTELDPYKAVAKLLSYVALFFGIAGWATTRERVAGIIKTLLVSTILVALFGFYQARVAGFTDFYFRLYPDMEEVFAAQQGWSGRITSFLFHYNSLAGYLNAVIPFALGVAVLGKTRGMRRLALVCLVTAGAALFLTGSRGGMVACGVFLLFSLVFLPPRRTTLAVVLASALLAMAIAIPLASTAGAPAERLQSVDDYTQQSRLALWGSAFIIFMHHPVLGNGFGTYRYAFHKYVLGINEDLDAHNLYLQTLSETGAIGFIVFFATVSWFFRHGIRLMKSSDPLWRIVGIGTAGALITTLTHGLVDYLFITSPQFGNLFWMVLALCLVACEMSGELKLSGSAYAVAAPSSSSLRGSLP